MNQIKTQLAAAALLDRALNAVTDDELRVLLDKVPVCSVSWAWC
jgi:hypothetical protein